MNSSDPIDHALAAIASIRDRPDARAEPEQASSPAPVEETPPAPAVEPPEPVVPPPIPSEPNGYSKAGPGPMEAIRFRWTVRRDDDGAYHVDESIGANTAVVSTGPMSGDAAIKLVDDRENAARLQFEKLKNEMTGRLAVNPDRGDASAM